MANTNDTKTSHLVDEMSDPRLPVKGEIWIGKKPVGGRGNAGGRRRVVRISKCEPDSWRFDRNVVFQTLGRKWIDRAPVSWFLTYFALPTLEETTLIAIAERLEKKQNPPTEVEHLRSLLWRLWDADRRAAAHGGSRLAHTAFGDEIAAALGEQPFWTKAGGN